MSVWSEFLLSVNHFIAKFFQKKHLEVVILFTSDVHGNIFPHDYILDKKEEWGLAKAATLIKKYRKKYQHVILLDNGDILQGSPLNYYYNFINYRIPYPIAQVMNSMHYTASSVGNHDIEQGPVVYNRIKNQLKFPWLSANAITSTGKSYFQPFTIREIQGIKFGILGLTTPAIPLWVNRDCYPGIRWQDMKTAASGWYQYLKEKKGNDVLIGLFHAGVNARSQEDWYPKDIPEENPCLEIAEQTPGFDVIIAGHEHKVYNNKTKKGNFHPKKSLLVMSGSHGRNLGVVHLIFTSKNGKWELSDKYARIESLQRTKPDPAIIKIHNPHHERIKSYINSEIGIATADISSNAARLQDNGFVDLIHRAQLNATTAEISFAPAFTTKYIIRKGPIRIKDVYGLYPYENKLYVILMTGQQIKDHLEQSSLYFNRINPDDPFTTPLVNEEFMGFNYDMAEGLSYEIDVTKPIGERIRNLKKDKGKRPFNLKRKYKVVTNSYRAIQLSKQYHCRILWKSNKEMRDILVEYIKKLNKIENRFSANWRLIPENLVSLIIKEQK